MNSQIESLFSRIETERKNLFTNLRQYSDETINKKPSPEAWSVSEVINHLMASESASLKYLQKKTLDTSKADKTGIKNAWKLLILKIAFVIPAKFKAPEVVKPESRFESLADSEKKWNEIRSGIYTLLIGLKEEDYEKEIWKHALGGKMNIYQMLDFFNFHFGRHWKQIERTLEAVAR